MFCRTFQICVDENEKVGDITKKINKNRTSKKITLDFSNIKTHLKYIAYILTISANFYKQEKTIVFRINRDTYSVLSYMNVDKIINYKIV